MTRKDVLALMVRRVSAAQAEFWDALCELEKALNTEICADMDLTGFEGITEDGIADFLDYVEQRNNEEEQ